MPQPLNAPRDDVARSLALRYGAAMLSAALVAAALGAGAAWSAGGMTLLPDLLLWTTFLLVGVNALGAFVLYRPVHRHIAGTQVEQVVWERRVRRLAMYSGLWILALGGAAMLAYAAAAHGGWRAIRALPAGAQLGAAMHGAVFAAFLGLYVYLMVVDFTISVRRALWRRGETLAPQRGRFARRLVAALAVVALGPALIALSDDWSGAAMPATMPMHAPMNASGAPSAAAPRMPMDAAMMGRFHERFMAQSRHMDLYAALALAALIALLLARGLSRPVDALLGAMRRVDEGALDARVPVVSDDEFGVLTERFDAMLEGLAERERMRRTFARFVPEDVAAALLADQGAIAPQEREATVLFTDIERFTQIASSLAPQQVLAMLNGYFDQVAAIIHRHRGVITQFQGDAVLASFNLPARDREHARNALAAALEIDRQLSQARFAGGIRLATRVGIATGRVVGGTVGGGERLGYTVHGDTVNLAARLEALNKELGSRILMDARSAELSAGRTPMRDRGEIEVRGFAQPLRVYEPVYEPIAGRDDADRIVESP